MKTTPTSSMSLYDIELTEDEKKFNKIFWSFRSTIEDTFGKLSLKFKYFDNNHAPHKLPKAKIYNLQLKFVSLLYNINKFIEKENIPVLRHHKLWAQINFNYPKPITNIKEIQIRKVLNWQNIKIIDRKQQQFLDDYSSNLLNEDIEMHSIEENVFEVEEIIDYKIVNNRMVYLVK